jgi:hypothetical protein
MDSCADVGAITMSSSESEIYVLISWQQYATVNAYRFNMLRSWEK